MTHSDPRTQLRLDILQQEAKTITDRPGAANLLLIVAEGLQEQHFSSASIEINAEGFRIALRLPGTPFGFYLEHRFPRNISL